MKNLGMVANTCNPNTSELKTEGSEVQSHPWLPSLAYMRPCLNIHIYLYLGMWVLYALAPQHVQAGHIQRDIFVELTSCTDMWLT